MAACGGLLSKPDFWQHDGDAPILKYNQNGWLEAHTQEAIAHAEGWLASLGVEKARVDIDTKPLSNEGARIFRADANRTYRSEPSRQLFIKLLSFAHTKFGDYQQSMGYVAGLLMLFFDPATTLKVLTVLNDHPSFLPGYWRGEATSCAVDGYVCFGQLNSALQAQLKKIGLLPETFVQKWFAGLCIHHLPYHVLVHFLDRFFSAGNSYLFQFFLAFFEEFQEDFFRATNPEANMLIRLAGGEQPPAEARLLRVVEAATAATFAERIAKLDLHRLRCAAFGDNLSVRLQRANEGMWAKQEEIEFSDED
uniref:Rab-GAP TBC domain-containing protein n=1 Tax=Alexandrium catenella TaxID=2925 RepID=A0A7S1PRW0_ALECA|mmetsp:Transcript_107430/g.285825  ORF Transcript_107430/g.285825 Transcript_107430/m.285825 type:complete len:308 (+) Transcript_107430:43-966(+)